jgi:phage terminase Nu1 subunit (DNA packaging protein)
MAFDITKASLDEIKNKCRLISKSEHGHEIQDQRITMMAKIYNCKQEADVANESGAKEVGEWLTKRAAELADNWSDQLND